MSDSKQPRTRLVDAAEFLKPLVQTGAARVGMVENWEPTSSGLVAPCVKLPANEYSIDEAYPITATTHAPTEVKSQLWQ